MENDMQLKKSALVKLFLSFPAASKMDQESVMMSVASYLETLQQHSFETLSAACDAFKRRASPFPPSCGELFTECEKIAAQKKRHDAWVAAGSPPARPAIRLGAPPRRGWSLEELADFDLLINPLGGPRNQPYTMRVDADGNPLTIPSHLPGAGTKTFYGYVTPAEAQARHARRERFQN